MIDFGSFGPLVGFLAFLFVVLFLLPRLWRRLPLRRWRLHRQRRNQATRVHRRLLEIEHEGQRIAYLRKIDPLAFEELLLTCAELRGWKIQRNKRYSGDGGVDGKLWVDGHLYLVQAKRYSNHVNRAHVAEFCRLVSRAKCRGLFIHTGRTGEAALDEVQGTAVEIISGHRLLEFLMVALPTK